MTEDAPEFYSDLDLVNLSLLNTPERVRRIEDFKVTVRARTSEGGDNGGRAEGVIEMTEPIVMESARVDKFYNYAIGYLGDKSPYQFDLEEFECKLTAFIVNLLYPGVALFADEVPDDSDVLDVGAYEAFDEKMSEAIKLRTD